MPDDQQQDPLKALEDLIAQRKAGAPAGDTSPPATVEESIAPQVDTEALLAEAQARDAVDIATQRQKFEELKQTSPQYQAATEQKQAAQAEQTQADVFSDDYKIRQIDHTTIPEEITG